MAFNSPYGFYPAYQMQSQPQYQNQYQQVSQNQYQAPQQSQDERIWVQNETAAEAYLVAPNSFVRLWDSSRPVFYEKRADMTGRPFPIETYEYTKITAVQPVKQEKPTVDYTEEIKALKRRIEALEKGEKYAAESNADDTGI